jgi:hypothetical protein
MVFAVTMNSKRNALLALMIATNFVELKGQVYKRTDTNKLWALACQVSVGPPLLHCLFFSLFLRLLPL